MKKFEKYIKARGKSQDAAGLRFVG